MMSKQSRKASSKSVAKAQSVPSEPILNQVLNWILGLPRLLRILIVAVFGLAVTIASSPFIDNFYLRFLFTEQTTILPSLVSVGLGVIMYMIGWVLVVGTSGETVPARKAVLWYVLGGILAVGLVVVLVIHGYSLATASTF